MPPLSALAAHALSARHEAAADASKPGRQKEDRVPGSRRWSSIGRGRVVCASGITPGSSGRAACCSVCYQKRIQVSCRPNKQVRQQGLNNGQSETP